MVFRNIWMEAHFKFGRLSMQRKKAAFENSDGNH